MGQWEIGFGVVMMELFATNKNNIVKLSFDLYHIKLSIGHWTLQSGSVLNSSQKKINWIVVMCYVDQCF